MAKAALAKIIRDHASDLKMIARMLEMEDVLTETAALRSVMHLNDHLVGSIVSENKRIESHTVIPGVV